MEKREIVDSLRQCERDLMKIDSNAPALEMIREAIRDLEDQPERKGAGLFAREFLPR